MLSKVYLQQIFIITLNYLLQTVWVDYGIWNEHFHTNCFQSTLYKCSSLRRQIALTAHSNSRQNRKLTVPVSAIRTLSHSVAPTGTHQNKPHRLMYADRAPRARRSHLLELHLRLALDVNKRAPSLCVFPSASRRAFLCWILFRFRDISTDTLTPPSAAMEKENIATNLAKFNIKVGSLLKRIWSVDLCVYM